MNFIINAIISNPKTSITTLVALLELFLRLKPTSKNLSIIDSLHKILNILIPNMKAHRAYVPEAKETVGYTLDNFAKEQKKAALDSTKAALEVFEIK